MSYELNEKAFYAPSGNHKELIKGRDLSELDIVIQDDNKMSSGFSINLEGSLFDANIYRYYNHGEWHIDHKIPLKYKHNGETPSLEEVAKRLHYINTQPLWASENMSKGNRYVS